MSKWVEVAVVSMGFDVEVETWSICTFGVSSCKDVVVSSDEAKVAGPPFGFCAASADDVFDVVVLVTVAVSDVRVYGDVATAAMVGGSLKVLVSCKSPELYKIVAIVLTHDDFFGEEETVCRSVDVGSCVALFVVTCDSMVSVCVSDFGDPC